MPAYTRFAETWLEQLLEADEELMAEVDGGIWNENAEQGTTGKIIVLRHKGTKRPEYTQNRLITFNDDRYYVLLTYLIPVIGENHTFNDLEAAANRLDDLLDLASGEVEGAKILWCYWLDEHKEKVPHGDQSYPELGAYWEIAVQPTP